jgi:hypothetical protein
MSEVTADIRGPREIAFRVRKQLVGVVRRPKVGETFFLDLRWELLWEAEGERMRRLQPQMLEQARLEFQRIDAAVAAVRETLGIAA